MHDRTAPHLTMSSVASRNYLWAILHPAFWCREHEGVISPGHLVERPEDGRSTAATKCSGEWSLSAAVTVVGCTQLRCAMVLEAIRRASTAQYPWHQGTFKNGQRQMHPHGSSGTRHVARRQDRRYKGDQRAEPLTSMKQAAAACRYAGLNVALTSKPV